MHSTIRRALYGISALITFADNATAQPHYLEPPRELAPGVFAILQRLPFLISDSNVLLIINDDDVIVVDANIVPSSARHVIGEIRKLTTKPVRYVVNTHWHSDHHYGNAVYREAFPGVEFIQHVETRKAIIERDIPALKANVDSAYPAAAATLRKALREGKTATGVELTAAMRDRFTDMAGIYDMFVADMKVTPMVPGTLLITDSLVLHRGNRTIVIKHLGLGNTAGDLVVHLPRERIVATGDLVVFPVPFAFYSYLSQWPKTLRTLTSLDAATIMPGHGPIMTSWNYANQLIPMIESTWQQVSRAVASGVTELDSVRKQVNLDQYRDQLAGSDARIRQQFDTWYMQPAVESAFKEIRPDTTKR
jgi:glyoxylase-like metal-dependent hydrolase (beta-lactamase superfamily II)